MSFSNMDHMKAALGWENIDGPTRLEIKELFGLSQVIIEKGAAHFGLQHSIVDGGVLFIAHGETTIERYIAVDPVNQLITITQTPGAPSSWVITMELLIYVSQVLPNIRTWVKG